MTKKYPIPEGWNEKSWADAMKNANRKFVPNWKRRGTQKVKSIEEVRKGKK